MVGQSRTSTYGTSDYLPTGESYPRRSLWGAVLAGVAIILAVQIMLALLALESDLARLTRCRRRPPLRRRLAWAQGSTGRFRCLCLCSSGDGWLADWRESPRTLMGLFMGCSPGASRPS